MTSERYPIIEIFGPTLQGEGPLIGVPTIFIRFGGCDLRCSWCDTMYAVDPVQVKKHAKQMTVESIINQIDSLTHIKNRPQWITLSGGNPALYPLGNLVSALRREGFKIAVETQGTKWQTWLMGCDKIVLAPKGPSSGMRIDLEKFCNIVRMLGVRSSRLDDVQWPTVYIKVVVFDDPDLVFAANLRRMLPRGIEFGLQVGNRIGTYTNKDLLFRLNQLAGDADVTEGLEGVRILPQLHVLLWGNEREK